MYTQCTHCEAVFRVNMREVTTAKGKLRCGECRKVFNATATLSTTVPKAFVIDEPVEIIKKPQQARQYTPLPPNFTVKGIEEKRQFRKNKIVKNTINEADERPEQVKGRLLKFNTKSSLVLPIVISLLVLLLVSQILYHYRHILTGAPINQPDKVRMLNHNVFTHPNEPNILLISATMESTAENAQPFPVLEVKLTNSASQVVALRRFKPIEYLEAYSPKQLLPVNTAIGLKLKIKDPGSKATGFEFNFY